MSQNDLVMFHSALSAGKATKEEEFAAVEGKEAVLISLARPVIMVQSVAFDKGT